MSSQRILKNPAPVVAHHRNGSHMNGFHVVRFVWKDGRTRHLMVATVFEDKGNIAVLDLEETLRGNVAFGYGNSWQGDVFESDLRRIIADYETARSGDECHEE